MCDRVRGATLRFSTVCFLHSSESCKRLPSPTPQDNIALVASGCDQEVVLLLHTKCKKIVVSNIRITYHRGRRWSLTKRVLQMHPT